MKQRRKRKWMIPVLLLGLAVSCSTPRKKTWLQDLAYNVPEPAKTAPELLIQPGDCLGISVSSEDPRLAAPFNAVLNVDETASAERKVRYDVDEDGKIQFPVLGMLAVEGKTLRQIRDEIASRIKTLGYIKEPVVNVTLDNFTVTVIGNVSNSVLQVEGSGINLLQVLARSGGTTVSARISDVMVIRTEAGKRTAYSVNLMSKALFDSPVFFLRQNDIVYVKPNGSSLSPTGQTVMTFVGSGLSLASIITNFLLWSRR